METWSGGRQCGAIRYEVAFEEVLTLVCCHCRECQRQSASAFGMSLILPRSAFRVAEGSMQTRLAIRPIEPVSRDHGPSSRRAMSAMSQHRLTPLRVRRHEPLQLVEPVGDHIDLCATQNYPYWSAE